MRDIINGVSRINKNDCRKVVNIAKAIPKFTNKEDMENKWVFLKGEQDHKPYAKLW